MGFAAVGAVIAVAGIVQQQEAEDQRHSAMISQQANELAGAAEKRKQFEAQQRIADIQNSRQQAEFARKARIAQGTITNEAANSGTMASSGVLGGTGSVRTQAASGQGTFGAILDNQHSITASQKAESVFLSNAGQFAGQVQMDSAKVSQWQQVTSLGVGIFTGNAKGANFTNIFDTSTKVNPPS